MALAVCLAGLLALGASEVARGQTEAVVVTSATNGDIVVVTLQPVEGPNPRLILAVPGFSGI